MTTRQQVDEFLGLRRIAVVGVSRNPKDFSYTLWQEFRQRRYEAVPVNPAADQIDGQACYARVQDIVPPVTGALLMTTPPVTERVVRDCAEAGIRHVWMYGGAAGPGAASREALDFCAANGIDVVSGQCPYMFLPDTPFFHGMHGAWKKLTGSYPK